MKLKINKKLSGIINDWRLLEQYKNSPPLCGELNEITYDKTLEIARYILECFGCELFLFSSGKDNFVNSYFVDISDLLKMLNSFLQEEHVVCISDIERISGVYFDSSPVEDSDDIFGFSVKSWGEYEKIIKIVSKKYPDFHIYRNPMTRGCI